MSIPDDGVVILPGVLVEMLGYGVLLQGESGIGKSDLALGLVDRGHRFVADDAIEFFKDCHARLFGKSNKDFSGFMEIRGFGVINLARLYGEQIVLPQAPIDLVVSLIRPTEEYWREADRLRCRSRTKDLLNVAVPCLELPYVAGRNMPLMIETALRLNMARQQGYDAASDFETRLSAIMNQGAA